MQHGLLCLYVSGTLRRAQLQVGKDNACASAGLPRVFLPHLWCCQLLHQQAGARSSLVGAPVHGQPRYIRAHLLGGPCHSWSGEGAAEGPLITNATQDMSNV